MFCVCLITIKRKQQWNKNKRKKQTQHKARPGKQLGSSFSGYSAGQLVPSPPGLLPRSNRRSQCLCLVSLCSSLDRLLTVGECTHVVDLFATGSTQVQCGERERGRHRFEYYKTGLWGIWSFLDLLRLNWTQVKHPRAVFPPPQTSEKGLFCLPPPHVTSSAGLDCVILMAVTLPVEKSKQRGKPSWKCCTWSLQLEGECHAVGPEM